MARALTDHSHFGQCGQGVWHAPGPCCGGNSGCLGSASLWVHGLGQNQGQTCWCGKETLTSLHLGLSFAKWPALNWPELRERKAQEERAGVINSLEPLSQGIRPDVGRGQEWALGNCWWGEKQHSQGGERTLLAAAWALTKQSPKAEQGLWAAAVHLARVAPRVHMVCVTENLVNHTMTVATISGAS